ncbi:hypothetical protein ACVOMV_32515 [Mesorhizobium atlanticum]
MATAQPVLSYDLGAAGAQLEPGISGSFTFKAGDKRLTKKLELEAMYNYFAAELSGPADPLLSLLRGKGDVTVSADKYGAATFPLKGSGAAIGKVLAEAARVRAARPIDASPAALGHALRGSGMGWKPTSGSASRVASRPLALAA